MEFTPRCGFCEYFEATPLPSDQTRGKCTNPDSDREQVDSSWIPYTVQKDSNKSLFNPSGRTFFIRRNPCFGVRAGLEMQAQEPGNSES